MMRSYWLLVFLVVHGEIPINANHYFLGCVLNRIEKKNSGDKWFDIHDNFNNVDNLILSTIDYGAHTLKSYKLIYPRFCLSINKKAISTSGSGLAIMAWNKQKSSKLMR